MGNLPLIHAKAAYGPAASLKQGAFVHYLILFPIKNFQELNKSVVGGNEGERKESRD